MLLCAVEAFTQELPTFVQVLDVLGLLQHRQEGNVDVRVRDVRRRLVAEAMKAFFDLLVEGDGVVVHPLLELVGAQTILQALKVVFDRLVLRVKDQRGEFHELLGAHEPLVKVRAFGALTHRAADQVARIGQLMSGVVVGRLPLARNDVVLLIHLVVEVHGCVGKGVVFTQRTRRGEAVEVALFEDEALTVLQLLVALVVGRAVARNRLNVLQRHFALGRMRRVHIRTHVLGLVCDIHAAKNEMLALQTIDEELVQLRKHQHIGPLQMKCIHHYMLLFTIFVLFGEDVRRFVPRARTVKVRFFLVEHNVLVRLHIETLLQITVTDNSANVLLTLDREFNQ